jgi:tetratricopeptide (TPR) repeat protein
MPPDKVMTQTFAMVRDRRFKSLSFVVSLLPFIMMANTVLSSPSLSQEVESTGDGPVAESVSADLEEADSNTLLGDRKSAIEKYTRVISKHPNNARALFNRGSALILSGDFSNAITDLEDVLKG